MFVERLTRIERPQYFVKRGHLRETVGAGLTVDVNQMVPGTASRLGPDMPASKWLMEVDEWAAAKWDGAMDILMSGTVAGIIQI